MAFVAVFDEERAHLGLKERQVIGGGGSRGGEGEEGEGETAAHGDRRRDRRALGQGKSGRKAVCLSEGSGIRLRLPIEVSLNDS
jgi:hypothetical protein